MEKEQEECLNPGWIDAENTLEFIYELSDKWKDKKDPVESMKADLRTMIRTFKEDKFEKMESHFGLHTGELKA